jgi:hypothetical protein
LGIDENLPGRQKEGCIMAEKAPVVPFSTLAGRTSNKSFKDIYGIIAEKDKNVYVGDSKTKPIVLSTPDADQIRNLLYEEVKARYVADGISFQSLSEVKQQYVKDGFFNPMTGVGMQGVDPGTWNNVNTPVSLSPQEATSYYASGGLGKIIVDKKAKGAMLNGYHFEAEFMTEKDKEVLKEYAQSIGFDDAVKQGATGALIFGGQMTYPVFKKDTNDTFCLPLNKLVDDKIIGIDCIERFVQADRWNCVLIPSYDITARDYVYPSTFFIPIGGMRLSTARCAMIRPTKLPYWGLIRQIGWGTSDYEGYIRSILAYRIIIASVPIMAQQMSLLVHEIPLDGIIAQNGAESANEFIASNNEALRKWSMNNPLTINSYGELKAVNRTFTNYAELIMSLRQDIGANCGLAESDLFDTQSKGFDDNVESKSRKYSETAKSVNEEIMPSFKNIIKIIIASCFGTDHEYFQKADRVRLSFESPEVVTNEERGKLLEKFANAVASLKGAGMGLQTAVKITQKFIPDFNLPSSLVDTLDDEVKEDKSDIPPFMADKIGEDGDQKPGEESPVKEPADGKAE